MRHTWLIMLSGFFMLGALAGGCTTKAVPTGEVTGGAAVYNNPADQAFLYHRQAAELREMARRLEFEAQFYAQRGGQDQEKVKRTMDLVKEMQVAADKAEERAREYRSRLPHNQVY